MQKLFGVSLLQDEEKRREDSRSCELCAAVWTLSVVSRSMKNRVQADGLLQPTWWWEWTPEHRARKNKKEKMVATKKRRLYFALSLERGGRFRL